MDFLTPGHGGDDPGASGNGIIEKDLNLKISQYMYDRFRELGIPVKIIRNSDETISPTDRTKRVLDAFGNNSNVIVISNHINAGGGEGAEVIYALRNNSELSNLVLEEMAKEGQKIRKSYQRRLPSDTSKDYYFMQRDTGITQPITVEYGFLDNTADATKLKTNAIKYAEATVRAVLDYIGYKGSSGNTGNTYIVKSGDSLYNIAKKYNISVEELKAANNLNNNLLSIGQVLKIPTAITEEPKPGDYIVYTVVKGDSLYSIGNKYKIPVNEIVNYNNLSSTNLNVGQKLLIPVTNNNTADYDTYIVKAGDNLYSIASKYNTTLDNLMKINNLSTNLLSIGQKLLVPKSIMPSVPNTMTYTVRSGDSLYSIAKKYNTTADELKAFNNLSSNVLSVGQMLKIPSDNNQITYTVRSGDSLYSIASKYNTTVDEIKKKNNLSSNILSIGQVLII